LENQEEDGRVTLRCILKVIHVTSYHAGLYFNNCTVIRYSNIQTCGNPPTCFGLFSGHCQGRIQRRKKWVITFYVYSIDLLDRND
jgi:hypothetical protein